ncbi:MAG: sensor histidine kinase [Ignavibacteriaceae bacterium]
MALDITQMLFLIATFLSAVGLIYIIYSRSGKDKKSQLFILILLLIIGYLISHSVHFLLMASGDVTILDVSCHSLLLLIIIAITFFTWNFPHPKKMGIVKSLSILIPSIILFVLLWSGNLIHQSHIHGNMFEAHFGSLYPLYLIFYVLLIALNFYWLIKKYYKENDELLRKQILMLTLGLIITNLISFIFGLFLPWYLGFYFLVEMSPIAFLIGVILFTTLSVSKYDMFPSLGRLHKLSIKKKIILSSLILVPIIILLVQIPLIKIIFDIKSNTELMRYFLLSVLGGMIVSVSIAFVIIKMIANPLNKLKSKAHEIEKGNYGIKLEIKTNDEIGELTEAFNNMSETLKYNTEELIKREKLAALGKMAAVLAHEIKTPLTSIKMNADIIAETLDLNDEDNLSRSIGKENFEIMKTEINRLNNLVKDVLQFSRQMELNFSEIKLKDLIDNVHNQLSKKLNDKNIILVNNTENVRLEADTDKLKQVFINLIDNSSEAVSQNGIIEISSRRNNEDNSISIFVKDNGSGIDPELKIFEPFFTTKASGTGLGLSISQKIIEQHDGAFNLVTSKKGETIFEIKLPIEQKHKEVHL